MRQLQALQRLGSRGRGLFQQPGPFLGRRAGDLDRKSTRLNSSHVAISYAVFCLKKKKNTHTYHLATRTEKVTSTTDPSQVLISSDPPDLPSATNHHRLHAREPIDESSARPHS